MRRLYLLFALVALFSFVACKKNESYESSSTTATATETTGTYTSSDTAAPPPAPAPLNDKDKDFVGSAERGGMSEVDLAQDGVNHATNPDVKAFAQKLVDDHTKANSELSQFATSRGVTTMGEMEAKMKETKERLAKLTGKSFDQAFVNQMVEDHTSTIKLFEEESASGVDTDLKAWVDKTLPTLREHLKAAQDLQAKIGKK